MWRSKILTKINITQEHFNFRGSLDSLRSTADTLSFVGSLCKDKSNESDIRTSPDMFFVVGSLCKDKSNESDIRTSPDMFFVVGSLPGMQR